MYPYPTNAVCRTTILTSIVDYVIPNAFMKTEKGDRYSSQNMPITKIEQKSQGYFPESSSLNALYYDLRVVVVLLKSKYVIILESLF